MRNHYNSFLKKLTDFNTEYVDEELVREFCRQCWSDWYGSEDFNKHTTALECGVVDNFIYYGKQVFELGPAMTRMLSETSLDNVKRGDVNPPYQSFWVSIPKGVIEMDTDIPGVKEDITGFYLSSYGDNFHVLICGAMEYLRWVPLDLEGKGKDLNIEEVVQLHGVEDDSPSLEQSLFAVRVAINLMLYLAQENAEMYIDSSGSKMYKERARRQSYRSESKKKKFVTEITNKNICRRHVVAKSIENSNQGTTCRHWVRGHWHTYLHGKGKTERKLKWVMPYERNKDNAPRKGDRVYNVKD